MLNNKNAFCTHPDTLQLYCFSLACVGWWSWLVGWSVLENDNSSKVRCWSFIYLFFPLIAAQTQIQQRSIFQPAGVVLHYRIFHLLSTKIIHLQKKVTDGEGGFFFPTWTEFPLFKGYSTHKWLIWQVLTSFALSQIQLPILVRFPFCECVRVKIPFFYYSSWKNKHLLLLDLFILFVA